MIEVEIPKDINKYEAKLIGPFTGRQAACFIGACVLAIPTFMFLKEIVPRDLASMVIVLICTPFILVGWIKPYGMTFEQFLKTALVSNVLAPKRRKYITMNSYEYFVDENFGYDKVMKTMTKMKPKAKRKEEARKIKTSIKYYN